jgi:hypothetical protein
MIAQSGPTGFNNQRFRIVGELLEEWLAVDVDSNEIVPKDPTDVTSVFDVRLNL